MRQPRSALLSIYEMATAAIEPAGRLLLNRRLKAGKEDAGRLGERSGHALEPRPDGPLVWVHGASVGEFLSLLPLIGRLVQTNVAVLATTGTLTSARIAADRLPAGAIHQFVPLDLPEAVRRFYAHWRPSLVLFAESELWPNLMLGALDRGAPLGIVNGRMSDRSFRRWRTMDAAIRPILSQLDLCLAQSEQDAGRYRALGAVAAIDAGNLKFDAEPLPFDSEALRSLTASLAGRPAWLAASTHVGEEQVVMEAHRRIAATKAGLLTIVAPRHPQRAAEIASEAQAAGLRPVRRSQSASVPDDCDVYVADTLGELGVFYRACPIALIGGSLLAPGGGHNPIEAAQLGCAIVHGPFIDKSADLYEIFDRAGAAITVIDAEQLATTVLSLLDDPGRTDTLVANARRCATAAGGATEKAFGLISALLSRPTSLNGET